MLEHHISMLNVCNTIGLVKNSSLNLVVLNSVYANTSVLELGLLIYNIDLLQQTGQKCPFSLVLVSLKTLTTDGVQDGFIYHIAIAFTREIHL